MWQHKDRKYGLAKRASWKRWPQAQVCGISVRLRRDSQATSWEREKEGGWL